MDPESPGTGVDPSSEGVLDPPLLHYQVFGHCLASEIPFPELRTMDPQSPRWIFNLMSREEVSSGGVFLGEESLYGEVSARLYRHPSGHRIEVDDTGVYDVTAERDQIRWGPNAPPWWDFGRGHLLGRVLSTVMHFSGMLVLHGSAVLTKDGVIAFLGPKGAGKSTLALALTSAGARFVTDDTLAVAMGSTCSVFPGVQSPRLEPGTAKLLGLDPGAVGRDGKLTTPLLPASSSARSPARLAAIYLLQPAQSGVSGVILERGEVGDARATVSVVGHAKIGAMLGPGEAATLLDRSASLAQSVSVQMLLIHRATDRLERAAAEILDWHGVP